MKPSYSAEIPLAELLDRIEFGDYWPEGSPELVREFLVERYDRDTMPTLKLAETKGRLWLLGWENGQHPDGTSLLEAARGYAMTPEEQAWARSDMAMLRVAGSGAEQIRGGHHRARTLRRLARDVASGNIVRPPSGED